MLRFFSIIVLVFAFVATNAQQRLYPVCINKMWGMIDAKGNLVVEAEYNSLGAFKEEGYAIAQKGDLLGVIDTLGDLLIPCKYPLMDYVGNGLFSIKKDGVWKVINTADVMVLDSMSGKISFLENGYLTFDQLDGTGLAHIERGVILPPNYSLFEFLSTQFIAASNGVYSKSLFDINGKQILPVGFELFRIEGNLIWGKRSGKWGAYDFEGNIVIDPEWTSYEALGNNFYTLTDEKEVKYLYSMPRDTIILSRMKSFSNFDDNYAQFVNFEDNKGLIDVNGNFIFEGLYDAISKFGENTFRLKKGDNLGIMDTKGNILAPFVYNMIGRPSGQVAIVKKNKNYGILNMDGELVLPAVYPVSLSLDDNIARYKDPNGVLQMFVFDENGQLKKNTSFTNLKSLRIRSAVRTFNRNPAVAQNNGTRVDPNQISDSLVWQFHVGARKWGLWNLETKRYKFAPQYDNILILKDLGITIVGKVKREIGGYINTGRLDLQINRVYGIYTNVHGLPISKMEFLDIRLSDFQEKGYDVARCVFIGGSQGVLSRSGRVLSRGYAYIGDFVEGRARATRKGKLLVDMDYKLQRPLIRAQQHFGSLMSRYAFDNDDDPRLYSSFAQDGQLYCKDAKWGYIDTLGEVFMNYKYDYLEDYTNGRALVRHKGQWGMLDNDGNEIIEPQYDDFNFLPKSDKKLFFIAEHRDLKGAIDSNANIVVPVEYSRVREFHDDRVAVRGVRGWGFVDRNAKEVIPANYRVVNDFSEGLAVIYEKSKWGAINKNGDVVIKAQYTRMGDFKEGKAWVNLNRGRKGYINKYGELLFSGKYTRVTNFKDGVARVYVRKKGWGLIDANGNYILKPKKSFKRIEEFNDYGLAKVKIGKKFRLINQEGKLVGKQAFGLIRDFKEGHAVVRLQVLGSFHVGKTNLNFGFIDTTGELVTKEDFRQLQDFSEGRAVFTGEGSKRGYINYQGEVVVQPQYFRAEDFSNNRAVVWESYNKTGIIDTVGTVIIPVEYDKILGIKEGLALVRKNSWTYYFVHEDMKRHSPSDFRGASTFQNNMAPIKEGHKWGVINEKGLKALTPKYAHIAPYQDGVAKVTVKNLLGVVDIDGNIVIDAEYEYIDYVGEGLFRVERGDKMGYLDMAGNWVWEMR